MSPAARASSPSPGSGGPGTASTPDPSPGPGTTRTSPTRDTTDPQPGTPIPPPPPVPGEGTTSHPAGQQTPTSAPTPRDRRLLRGHRTRAAILDTAVALASVEGLDGLTLGRLAAERGVSKSGLFAHWRDKEALQLAVVDRAREQWSAYVIDPAGRAPAGVRRLWALHAQRIAFYENRVLPGGCFFTTAVFEFDDHPGAVRDHIFTALRSWLRLLRETGAEAVSLGELRPDTDPKQLAFEIQAIGVAVVPHSRMLTRDSVFAHARRAVADRLRALSPNPALLDEPYSPGGPS